MMGDLFWDIATSMPVLGAIVALLAAALVVGYFPLLKWFPGVGQYVAAARLVVLIAAALLFFLVGFRVSDQRTEAKSLRLKIAAQQIDINAANAAADRMDAALNEAAQRAGAAKERIEDYEERLRRRAANAACILVPDDFADRVRNNRKRAP